jgi:hypothetical protein
MQVTRVERSISALFLLKLSQRITRLYRATTTSNSKLSATLPLSIFFITIVLALHFFYYRSRHELELNGE